MKRRPFWLPASNYYVLAFALGLAFFFLLWGILHDGGDEMPWVISGIAFSILMVGAVILRELILRRARNRYLAMERNFDRQLVDVYSRIGEGNRPEKLTLEKNASILADIKRKSEAAKVLGKFADAHREVFEICEQYLSVNEREARTVQIGSPRLKALRKGKESASRFHRFHLLQWAEIETRNMAQEVQSLANASDKVTALQSAVSVIDSALEYYPAERSLIDSRMVLNEMLTSIRVSHFVEDAERSAFKGEYKQAISQYRDALFYLGRDNLRSEQRDSAARRINIEIDRLRQIEDQSI